MDFSKPWSEYTFVGFDTETSGKYPLSAEIVEVAATKWKKLGIKASPICPIKLKYLERMIAAKCVINEPPMSFSIYLLQ